MPLHLFAESLLSWYDAHARDLPWRGIHDPYRTWVSETMLQQTRVETVLSYYQRFLDRFPTVEALASAPEADVLKMWEGLGYYRRARNLQKGAQQIVTDFGGVIPTDPAQLRKISGIGDYTAGAIASIAYGVQTPAVDGNVIRVTSRVCGIRDNVGIPSVKRRIAAETAALVPADRPGDFNQAMMDLGATICVPGTPSCERCPVCSLCDAYREGDAEDIPDLPRKNPPRPVDYDVCLIFAGNRVLMRQRTETMLQGLWIYPLMEEHRTPAALTRHVQSKLGLRTGGAAFAADARHIFTHQIWTMKVYVMEADADAVAPAGWRFVSLEEMEQLALPTAVKKATSVAKAHLNKHSA